MIQNLWHQLICLSIRAVSRESTELAVFFAWRMRHELVFGIVAG